MFKPHMVALDLEMNQPSGKIIQIGACVGDITTGEVLSVFSAFVHPYEAINPRITTLTGITNKDMATATPLAGSVAQLESWLLPYEATRALNPLTWGGGDSIILREQLNTDDDRWVFGRRWLDVKTLFVAWRLSQQKTGEGGLARSMTKLRLAFEGRKHNAQDDAVNTFRMFMALKAKLMP
ncbi:MAG: exonuclease domain-containing protein [Candidatus Nanopelagicales bacterium]